MAVNLQSRVINLRRNLLALGAVVEQRVASIIDVIRDGDVDLARTVRMGDAEVDQMQLELEAECMRLLALGSPVASDLRLILTAMRVSNELPHRDGRLQRTRAHRRHVQGNFQARDSHGRERKLSLSAGIGSHGRSGDEHAARCLGRALQ
ncbi:MAG: hypothetical protein DWI12_00575 [Planctomycetota bacterium]|nr:MAG: hypothetical protein DWI12_00575 [Planctomycetota bacterium]